jgi:hypothetical protein
MPNDDSEKTYVEALSDPHELIIDINHLSGVLAAFTDELLVRHRDPDVEFELDEQELASVRGLSAVLDELEVER